MQPEDPNQWQPEDAAEAMVLLEPRLDKPYRYQEVVKAFPYAPQFSDFIKLLSKSSMKEHAQLKLWAQ
jgi:hypothetical protein